jgi:hypothetical protein
VAGLALVFTGLQGTGSQVLSITGLGGFGVILGMTALGPVAAGPS